MRPSNVEDVQRIVREVREVGWRIRGLGYRHLIHDTICMAGKDDGAIDMGAFASLEVAIDNKIATIGTGVELGNALTRLKAEEATLLIWLLFSGLMMGGIMGMGGQGSMLLHPTNVSN